MFDHSLYQDNLVGVDYCEKMVRETNPTVWEKAQKTVCPHAEIHGFSKISDIMRALNPFEGKIYKEALQISRLAREMFCLMEGRHVHPSTIYPGGVGTVPSVQLFMDYQARLMKYVDYLKRAVPLHDDLFDFFYEALPGYELVGNRKIQLGCWGTFNNPDFCDYRYETMTDWGREMFVSPGIVLDGELVTTDLHEINLGIRILLGGSFYDDWTDDGIFVEKDSLGNKIDIRHPWNQTTKPRPQKRDFNDKYTWVVAPRWFDEKSGKHIALDTGGGDVEFVGVENDTVFVRLSGACNGCSQSAVTLREGVEEAILTNIPQIKSVQVVPNEPSPGLIQIESLSAAKTKGWIETLTVEEVPAGKMKCFRDEKHNILLVNIENRLSAFRNECPHQGLPLDGGMLEADERMLTCPWHGFKFDASSGECLTAPAAQLESFPLRVENGRILVRPS